MRFRHKGAFTNYENMFWAFFDKVPTVPSINYVVSRGEGGGQKLPILLSKKTTKRGEGVKNCRFRDDIVYVWPLS